MPRPPQFFFDFARTMDYMLNQVSGVSRRDFARVYDYDDFLEREAIQCASPRELAMAFALRFFGTVSPMYLRVCSLALVRFLVRQSGRAVDEADNEAVRALAELDPMGEHQLDQWFEAYFRDVR